MPPGRTAQARLASVELSRAVRQIWIDVAHAADAADFRAAFLESGEVAAHRTARQIVLRAPGSELIAVLCARRRGVEGASCRQDGQPEQGGPMHCIFCKRNPALTLSVVDRARRQKALGWRR